jgi:multidrug efflux system outer membrane protein
MTASIQRLGLAALVALSVGGCATPMFTSPKVQPDTAITAVPAFTPSATATVKPGLSIDRWWTLFGDPYLERLMDEALARNEDLESAVARVREAQASLDIAHAALLPTVEIEAEASRSQQSQVGAVPVLPGMSRRSTSHHVVLLAAGYELDLWGKLSSSTASARRQLLGEFDLRRAEAELLGTEATLASLARQRIALERALTAFLGRTPNEIVTGELPRISLDERKPLNTVFPEGAAADLLVRRPDIRQVEAQLEAANFSIDAARAARFRRSA